MLPEMKYQVMAVRRRRKTLQQKYATMHRMFTVVMYVLVCWCYSCSTPLTHAWSPIAVQTIATNLHNQQPSLQPQQQHQQKFANYPRSQTSKSFKQQTNEISPYVDLVLCPVRAEPWSCARQQSARILDVWESGLHTQWQKFKVEADRELNATLERRGFSGSEVLTKEKPSSILKKIELGTNYLKDSLSKSLDRFWGHETKSEIDQDVVQEKQTDEHNANVNEPNDNNLNDEGDEDEEEEEEEEAAEGYNNDAEHKLDLSVHNNDTTEGEIEFFELNDDGEEGSDDEPNGQLKKPGGGGKRKKNKNKRKKGQHDAQVQPATVLLLQQPAVAEEHHEHGGAGTEEVHVSSGHDEGRPNKFKRKKDRRQKRRKNKHQHNHGGLESSEDDLLSSLLEGHGAPSGLGLLENLDVDDWLVDGGKRKKGYPSKYGRSNGVTRGKKKKKKKALMKLVLLGQFLKAKIELLLKLLGAHLQIKFFAIALIGLLINIARFWIDVKRGAPPQKVVYVEHAHHQHHYEDHGEEWNEPGGYWKRSLHTDTTPEGGSATDSYLPQDDAHYLAYRNSNPQWQ